MAGLNSVFNCVALDNDTYLIPNQKTFFNEDQAIGVSVCIGRAIDDILVCAFVDASDQSPRLVDGFGSYGEGVVEFVETFPLCNGAWIGR